jgi:hypothetical protein
MPWLLPGYWTDRLSALRKFQNGGEGRLAFLWIDSSQSPSVRTARDLLKNRSGAAGEQLRSPQKHEKAKEQKEIK